MFRSFCPTVLAALLALILILPGHASAGPANAADELSFSQPQPTDLPFLTASTTPALRLLYTGNTRGALFPCPT